jgi:hypothetical protein
MTSPRLVCLSLVLAASGLLLTQSAAAMGGKGGAAAVVIDSVQFSDLSSSGKTNIEILGGGFLNGSSPVVTLDGGAPLEIVEATRTSISANIPAGTPDDDYLLAVTTGSQSKNYDAIPIHLGGDLHVVCIDWYVTTGPDHHIHAEAFVQDEAGDEVIGAAVTLENTVDGTVYQTITSTTFKYAGYNHGESCPIEVARESGATGQACCIGNATDPPDDSRSCETGLYEAVVIAIEPPAGSDRRWDGVTPENSRQFDGPQ